MVVIGKAMRKLEPFAYGVRKTSKPSLTQMILSLLDSSHGLCMATLEIVTSTGMLRCEAMKAATLPGSLIFILIPRSSSGMPRSVCQQQKLMN